MAEGDAGKSAAGGTEPTVTVIGSYKLLEPLGSGGMSSVFRARHLETGSIVALKVLPRSLARNTTLLQRFLREAKNAELLQHNNIVSIFDRGMESGRYYLVMDYVVGGDLLDLVRSEGAMPWREAVQVARQIAEGLRYAAGKGLIHRDVKPANILITPSGVVKIADLGLALQIEEEDERVTRDGTTVGTVDYMSPEQARDSRAANARSDMYSLGCTLYYLLTGLPPFPTGDIAEKLRQHATAPPPDVREHAPETPTELASLVKRLMAKKSESRFADYDELIAAFDALPSYAPEPSAPLAIIDEDSDDGPLSAIIDEPPEAIIDEDGPPEAIIDDEIDERRPLEAIIDEDDGYQIEGGYSLAGPSGIGVEIPQNSTLDISRGTDSTESTRSPSPPRRARPLDTALPISADAASWLGDLDAIEQAAPKQPVARTPIDPRPPLDPAPAAGVDLYSDLKPPPLPPRDDFRITKIEALRWSLIASTAALVFVIGWTVVRPMLMRPTIVRTAEPIEPVDDGGDQKSPVAANPEVVRRKATRPPPAPIPAIPNDTLVRLDLREPIVPPPSSTVGEPLRIARAVGPNARDAESSLERALEATRSSVIEITDVGPFYVEPSALGRVRLIRAASGFRPMVVFTRSSKKTPPSAALTLSNRPPLEIEGIDLVVDLAEIDDDQAALFECAAAGLTLRDCTVTVVGKRERPWSLVRVIELAGRTDSPASTLGFERTWIRGTMDSIVRCEAACDAAFDLCVATCRDGRAIETRTEREFQLQIARSIIASKNEFLAIGGDGGRPKVRVVQSQLSNIGDIASTADGILISTARVLDSKDKAAAAVDWRGDRNDFNGFDGWLVGAAGSTANLPSLSAFIATQGETEGDSHSEEPPAWTSTTSAAWADWDSLHATAGRWSWVADRVPTPTAELEGRTIGRFAISKTNDGSSPSSSISWDERPFDTSQEPWNGDLGRFLADLKPRPAKGVRIRVRGAGTIAMTPAILPIGVQVEIVVEHTAPDRPLVWVPAEGSKGRALLHSREGALLIEGARFALHGDSALDCLVRAEGGTLVLKNCSLVAPATVAPGGGGLVVARSGGRGNDRSVFEFHGSVFRTGGTALRFELDRGRARLEECVVIAGMGALEFSPVSRGVRLEADLEVIQSTIVAERDLARLRVVEGTLDTPERPWVVHSRNSAWIGDFDWGPSGTALGVLLRVDASAFAHGVLVWQSERDLFDVPRFLIAGDAPPDPSGRVRPDLSSQWLAVWGESHIRDPIADSDAVRLKAGRLRPGEVTPRDLELIRSETTRTPIGASLDRLDVSGGGAEGAGGRGR
jgi:serine/threonine-protein kinase